MKRAYFLYRKSDGAGLGRGWVQDDAWEAKLAANPDKGFMEISPESLQEYRLPHRFYYDGSNIQPKQLVKLQASKFKLRAGQPATWKVVAADEKPLYEWAPETYYDMNDLISVPNQTVCLQLIAGHVTHITPPTDLVLGTIIQEDQDYVELNWQINEPVQLKMNSFLLSGKYNNICHIINSGSTRDMEIEIDAAKYYSEPIVINSYEVLYRGH